MTDAPKLLILTPLKNAACHVDSYFDALQQLSYPKEQTSIACLESDSEDGTFEVFASRLEQFSATYRRTTIFRKHFDFRLPKDVPRYAPQFQVERRIILAKSRNHLLFRALEDEDWVLWLDADVVEYPAGIVERLLETGKDIVQPNCVYQYGGTSFDLNAWRDHGAYHMHDMKGEGELAPLDSVGGTMLLVRADVHRDGLVFPPFPYGIGNPRIRTNNYWLGEIETEGLGIMAADMGVQCWAMPNLEIRHHHS